MKTTKKLFALALAAALVLCAACSNTAPSASSGKDPAGSGSPSSAGASSGDTSALPATTFPDGKTITIMCGFSAGGVNDLACRVIAPYLGKYLDTNVEVVNAPGASGWVQVLDMIHNTEADGYTIGIWADGMQFVRHSASAHYDEGIDQMTPLGSYASDTGALACSPDETRWTDISSLIEYAKENVVTVSVTALEGEDYIPIAIMNNELGTKFEAVLAVDGATQGIANVMGGHVDIVSDNIAALNNYIQDGSLKGLCVFSEEPSAMWPEVPTFTSEVGHEINFANTRGFAAPAGLDPAVEKVLVDGIKAAVTDPDCIAELNALGLNNAYLDPQEFYDKNIETETLAMEIAKSMGWDWT